MLQKVTTDVMMSGMRNPNEIGAAAVEYLRLFGIAACGWMWVRMAAVASARIAAGASDTSRYEAKLTTARFFVTRLLPQTRALAAQIAAGAKPVMALDPSAL
jgi:hypothetical protein